MISIATGGQVLAHYLAEALIPGHCVPPTSRHGIAPTLAPSSVGGGVLRPNALDRTEDDRAADAAGLWAVLQVQDHGLGIPAADLPHIFDRFHRGRHVAGRIPGTGIGLAGARQIVE